MNTFAAFSRLHRLRLLTDEQFRCVFLAYELEEKQL